MISIYKIAPKSNRLKSLLSWEIWWRHNQTITLFSGAKNGLLRKLISSLMFFQQGDQKHFHKLLISYWKSCGIFLKTWFQIEISFRLTFLAKALGNQQFFCGEKVQTASNNCSLPFCYFVCFFFLKLTPTFICLT